MTDMLATTRPGKLIINGEAVDAATGRTFRTMNPATEEAICEVAEAGPEDVDRAKQDKAPLVELTYNWDTHQYDIGNGFGHFFRYAPEKSEYAINRFAMEVKRILDVADRLRHSLLISL